MKESMCAMVRFFSGESCLINEDGFFKSTSVQKYTCTGDKTTFEFADGRKVQVELDTIQAPANPTDYIRLSRNWDVLKSTPNGISSITVPLDNKNVDVADFYANGKLASVTPYFKGKIDGCRFVFDQEGHLMREEMYKDGKLNGQMVAYWENGNPRWICDYKDGLENGPFLQYDKEKHLLFRCTCKDGQRQGEYYKTARDGIILEKGVYVNNVKTQVWTNEDKLDQIQTKYEAALNERVAEMLSGRSIFSEQSQLVRKKYQEAKERYIVALRAKYHTFKPYFKQNEKE